ncbi:MAG: glycosyl hydrolase [Gemmatimonadota bacterium]|nr:MAG: glycosyl hydrolase [Gemmatimonadota bacterium]
MSTRLEYVWRGCVLLAALLALPAVASAQAKIESAAFGGLRARPIGPATMSGRIAAMDAVSEYPLTIYVGSASGGVWKSDDGGLRFEPIFDDYTMSIGAIRIDPSNPEVVWVGTGETWVRNSVSVGDGVYKTTDGGDTWQHLGLEDSERIARIEIDPLDGDRVYVCATGHLWDANAERGVFRTTDGGATWEKVLYIDEDTGCSDLSMDPHAPNILYAGMWEFRRWPYFFNSGGPGSGLYRSVDGGDTWEELTVGLPEGDKGRIAVAVSPPRPTRVYAVVEAEETALYRSDDMGATWEEMNSSMNVTGRPFYFAYVVPDPVDPDRVFKPGLLLTVSSDGGKSFSSPFSSGGFDMGSVHSDHHAMWIDPNNNKDLILGTDGGVYFSYDGGIAWRHSRGLPVSQFYEISYDMEFPYNVYGGLQDNGTWVGPSRKSGGIMPADWDLLFSGDGFHVFVDPADPDFVYLEYQGGNLSRLQKSTGETKEIRPYPEEGETKLRFNWNTPIHVSQANPGTLYLGAQYLYRTRARGDSWARISPDLTTNDPQKQRQAESGGLTTDNTTAENHTTIYTISESPLNAEVIWVGTDDGNLQVTRDDGANWRNVVRNVPGLPRHTWVSHVEASRHDAATAYVTFDGHRAGDMTTYLYRTRDYGATWESLVSEDIEGFAFVVKEDLENRQLLFLGTEFGLYISVDGGQSWARYASDFPRVAVHDLAIQPRENDLIIGTHGRGIYILDDITPLRGLTPDVLEADLTILPSRPAVQLIGGGEGAWFPGNDQYVGRNPPEAASVVYYQKRRHIFGDMKLEVYDAEGELITTIPAGKVRGINRVDWPMRLPPPPVPPASSLVPVFDGPRVLEGTYTYKLIKGSDTYEGQLSLVPDPRSPHSAEDRRLQQRAALRIHAMIERLSYVVDAVIDLRDEARARAEAVGGGTARRLNDYADELEQFRGDLVSSEVAIFSTEGQLRENLGGLYGAVNGYAGRPSEYQLERMENLSVELDEAEVRFSELTSQGRLEPLNSRLEREEVEPLVLKTREEWEAERGSS